MARLLQALGKEPSHRGGPHWPDCTSCGSAFPCCHELGVFFVTYVSPKTRGVSVPPPGFHHEEGQGKEGNREGRRRFFQEDVGKGPHARPPRVAVWRPAGRMEGPERFPRRERFGPFLGRVSTAVVTRGRRVVCQSSSNRSSVSESGGVVSSGRHRLLSPNPRVSSLWTFSAKARAPRRRWRADSLVRNRESR